MGKSNKRLKAWRCKSCEKSFTKRGKPQKCPYCGSKSVKRD